MQNGLTIEEIRNYLKGIHPNQKYKTGDLVYVVPNSCHSVSNVAAIIAESNAQDFDYERETLPFDEYFLISLDDNGLSIASGDLIEEEYLIPLVSIGNLELIRADYKKEIKALESEYSEPEVDVKFHSGGLITGEVAFPFPFDWTPVMDDRTRMDSEKAKTKLPELAAEKEECHINRVTFDTFTGVRKLDIDKISFEALVSYRPSIFYVQCIKKYIPIHFRPKASFSGDFIGYRLMINVFDTKNSVRLESIDVPEIVISQETIEKQINSQMVDLELVQIICYVDDSPKPINPPKGLLQSVGEDTEPF